MSANAIKLLNIQYVIDTTDLYENLIRNLFRREVLRNLASKLIGEGC